MSYFFWWRTAVEGERGPDCCRRVCKLRRGPFADQAEADSDAESNAEL
jgi:hypothetical protein